MRAPEPEHPASLRAAQVAQTRAALLAAGRRLFGEYGFRSTSVEDLAREARVTTGALYHHFPTKTALFEAVFTQAHVDLLMAATHAAQAAAGEGPSHTSDDLALGVDAFLDGILQRDIQRILVLDGPAVLGLARFTELDEQYAHAAIMHALVSVAAAGGTQIDDPDTATSLLLGALTRGAMLIANSADPVETRHAVARSMRSLLNAFTDPARPPRD